MPPGYSNMSRTDRQSDNPKEWKATHWKSAIYDEKDPNTPGPFFSGQWKAFDALPIGFTVYKKKEICPTTGREHFQTHVDCGRQSRLSALTNWIKHTKWFPVKGQEHIQNSISYINKLDTTAPGAKLEITKGEEYFRIDGLLMTVARNATFSYKEITRTNIVDDISVNDMLEIDANNRLAREQYSWRTVSRQLVRKDLNWINKLSNPILRTLWDDYYPILLEKVEEERGGLLSLRPPQDAKIILDSPNIADGQRTAQTST